MPSLGLCLGWHWRVAVELRWCLDPYGGVGLYTPEVGVLLLDILDVHLLQSTISAIVRDQQPTALPMALRL